MNIAFIGCGYVFDIYMRTVWAHPELRIRGVFDINIDRSAIVSRHYSLHVYPSREALLDDPDVELVVNLTSIRSHYEVTRAALLAGKHVYSEKPLTTDLDSARELFAIAASCDRVFTGAPCNIFSDAIFTVWKALRDGAVGRPALVYAELDDNPAHLMNLERVQSPTGAPFPYAEELQEGCTVEHVAYHLVWLCALFGPVVSLTAFSTFLIPDKVAVPLDPPDTPDLSVACLTFEGGLTARLTCSWVGPRDHRLRIIGNAGEIAVDNVFHDQSPVTLERFSRVSLAARKAYTARTQPLVGKLFGVGGRRIPLVRRWKSHAVEAERGVGRSLKHRLVSWLRRREIYAQDKFLGIAEMAKAMREGRRQLMAPDFMLHLTELTFLIHGAGCYGRTLRPTTTFAPIEVPVEVRDGSHDYLARASRGPLEGLMTGIVDRLHQK